MARLPKLRRKQARNLWTHVGKTVQEKDASYANSMLPKPHNVLVVITGRILTEDHVRAGAYIPPQELDRARRLLASTSMSQPTFEEMMRAASDASSLSKTGARPASVDSMAMTAGRCALCSVDLQGE